MQGCGFVRAGGFVAVETVMGGGCSQYTKLTSGTLGRYQVPEGRARAAGLEGRRCGLRSCEASWKPK